MIIWFKGFHDSINIAVILATVREFYSAKCAQLPKIDGMKLNEGHFPFKIVSFIFVINFK